MVADITTAPRIQERIFDDPASGAPPGSSLWWVERLSRRLYQRNRTLDALRAYYRGEQDTWRLTSESHRSAFGRLFDGLKANLAKPIVDAVEQRLTVEGFRLGDDTEGAQKAWQLWQASGLDADSSLAHTEALSVGECPVIVWQEPGASVPHISVEDPLQVYVEYSSMHRRVPLAGLKRWVDPDERATFAVLYLPDRVEWWVNRGSGWQPGISGRNPLGRVPIVVLWNMPRLVEPPGRFSRGEAEHEAVYTLLDLYNKTLLDMATTSEFMAFPQRYAIGVSLEDESFVPEGDTGEIQTDGAGKPIQTEAASLKSGPNRLWKFENPDTSVGQFSVAGLEPYIRALEAIRSDISSATHTPHRKLLPPPTSVPPSGESVRLSDEGLTAKVRRKQTGFGDGWEDVIRMAFAWTGDLDRANRMDIETLWRDPEVHTEAEHMDALVKLHSMGLPLEAILERVPMSPAEIARVNEMLQRPDQSALPQGGTDG